MKTGSYHGRYQLLYLLLLTEWGYDNSWKIGLSCETGPLAPAHPPFYVTILPNKIDWILFYFVFANESNRSERSYKIQCNHTSNDI